MSAAALSADVLVVRPGFVQPYGATPVEGGVNFAIHSTGATAVELVLFRRGEPEPFAELPFPERFRVGGVYAMAVLGLDPDTIEYGYRVHGPRIPAAGDRFDPGVILTDPYARQLGGGERWGRPYDDEIYRYRAQVPAGDFDWGDDRPLGLPMHELVIYEAHVRGFTRHPSSGVASPGTFAGLQEKVPYLRRLGVNCVELLPVFEFDESDNVRSNPLTGARLHNYWGYNTVGFFAPKASYAATTPVSELKSLVKALHAAGIEVLLDVVFNHTAEGNHLGPAISFRGLDNRAYYMLTPDGGYLNFTGTGNTFNGNDPVARGFILDCLRYWVGEFHIDGFRFDLASALSRAGDGTPLANPPLLEAIAADPALRDTKLIAEAWDAGGLYQVGSFPHYGRWSEWNGRYRDATRRFLRGDPGSGRELATRLVGSPDLYHGRGPAASVNFISSHDGFTLYDLVAYNGKHNEANGEDNRDGDDNNLSWNCGAEGPTHDQDVLELRTRQLRNALLLLLLSHGVPMFTAGDEMGRSQLGNNNAYCQDNEISWLDWTLTRGAADLLTFTRAAIAFRHAHPALRPAVHVDGTSAALEMSWHGERAFEPDWDADRPLLAAMFGAGQPNVQDVVYLAANAHSEPARLELPDPPPGHTWAVFADTAAGLPAAGWTPGSEPLLSDQHILAVASRSVQVLTALPKRAEDRS
jgi:glycogen operon protein